MLLNKWARISLFLLMLLYPLIAQEDLSRNIYSELASFYPNAEGTENEFLLTEFLKEELDREEIPYTEISYREGETTHSFSHSLEVVFNKESQERLFIALSLEGDSPYSSVNPVILLKVASLLKKNPPPKGVTLLFLGGERNTPPVGSNSFLEDFTLEEHSSLIYLDISSSSLYLDSSSMNQNAPLWLVKELSHSLDSSSLTFSSKGIKNLLSRTGVSMEPSPITPWLERDIPALLLGGNQLSQDEPFLGEEEISSSLTLALQDFINRYGDIERDNQEKNYILLTQGNQYWLIKEFHSILTIIGLLSIFTLIITFQSRSFTLNMRKNRKNLWVLPLIFSLVFLFLYLSTLLLEEIIYLKNLTDLWLEMPRLLLYFKLMLTLLLSSLFLFILLGLPIPRTPHFYSYGAIIFSIINFLMLLYLDISLIYYALWLLGCLFPFALARKIMVKTIVFLILPIPLIAILSSPFLLEYKDLMGYLLLDRVGGNLTITSFLMPLILTLTSLHYSRFYYHRERRSYTAVALFLIVPIAVSYLLVRIILFTPFSSQVKQPVDLVDRIDYAQMNRTITLTSPRALGAINLEYDNNTLALANLREKVTINSALDNSYLTYTGQLRSFLDRKRLLLTVEPISTPQRIEIRLFSDQGNISIYDCNYPYINSADNKQTHIIVGKNPTIPLFLDLTLTADSLPQMIMTITYEHPPTGDPVITNRILELSHTMKVIEQWDLTSTTDDFIFPPTE